MSNRPVKDPVQTKENNPQAFSKIFKKKYPWIILILLLVTILFGGFIFSAPDMALFGSDQFNGIDGRSFMHQCLHEYKQIPKWFSVRLGGMPTADALFGDLFYPPVYAFKYAAKFYRVYGWTVVLHVFLAGLFFFLMLRNGFKCNNLVSFVGATFYMLGPQFISHTYPGHDGKMIVIAWVPFVVWQIQNLIQNPRILFATLAGFGVGMMLLSSHVQMTYFVLWGLFFQWLTGFINAIVKKEKSTQIIKIGTYFWVSIAIGLAIGLIQIYPAFMYVREAFSVRGVDRGFEHAASWSMHWPEFFSLIVPEFCGDNVAQANSYWSGNYFKLNTEYAGAIPLLFAVIAIILKPSLTRILWGSVALFATLYALGANTPLFKIVYTIVPGVTKFRAPSMIMFWFTFAISLLGAFALNDLMSNFRENLKSDKDKFIKKLYIAVGGCVLFAIILSLRGVVESFASTLLAEPAKKQAFESAYTAYATALWLGWVPMVLICLGTIIFYLKGKITGTVIVAVALVLSIIDMMRVDFRFIQVQSIRPYVTVEPAIEDLQSKMKNEPFRIFPIPGSLPQNGGGIFNLESVTGFHDNELRWYRQFRGDQQDRNYLANLVSFDPQGQPFLNGANLETTNAFLSIANSKYTLVRGQDGNLVAIENKNALPRLSFAKNFVVMDSSKIIESLYAQSYDWKTTVAFTQQPQNIPNMSNSDSLVAPQVTSQWKLYTPNKRVAEVNVPQNGFLRIAEVFYPGWRILVDKKEVKALQADISWMAIPIEKGTHEIEISPHSLYVPKVIMITLGMGVILLLYWFSLIGLSFVKRK